MSEARDHGVLATDVLAADVLAADVLAADVLAADVLAADVLAADVFAAGFRGVLGPRELDVDRSALARHGELR